MGYFSLVWLVIATIGFAFSAFIVGLKGKPGTNDGTEILAWAFIWVMWPLFVVLFPFSVVYRLGRKFRKG